MLRALAVAADGPPHCFPITWSGAAPSNLGFTQATGIHNIWTDRDPQHQEPTAPSTRVHLQFTNGKGNLAFLTEGKVCSTWDGAALPWNEVRYAVLPLLGKKLLFDVDLSLRHQDVGCGCSASVSLLAMPGGGSKAGDGYCTWPQCTELQLIKASARAIQTSYNSTFSTTWGHEVTPRYGPEAGTLISSAAPFSVEADLSTDGEVFVKLSQDSTSHTLFSTDDVPKLDRQRMRSVLYGGMVLAVSLRPEPVADGSCGAAVTCDQKNAELVLSSFKIVESLSPPPSPPSPPYPPPDPPYSPPPPSPPDEPPSAPPPASPPPPSPPPPSPPPPPGSPPPPPAPFWTAGTVAGVGAAGVFGAALLGCCARCASSRCARRRLPSAAGRQPETDDGLDENAFEEALLDGSTYETPVKQQVS